MYEKYFILKEDGKVMSVDYFGFSDYVNESVFDKCLIALENSQVKVFRSVSAFIYHYEDKYNTDSSTVTLSINKNYEAIAIKLTFSNGETHIAYMVDFID